MLLILHINRNLDCGDVETETLTIFRPFLANKKFAYHLNIDEKQSISLFFRIEKASFK